MTCHVLKNLINGTHPDWSDIVLKGAVEGTLKGETSFSVEVLRKNRA